MQLACPMVTVWCLQDRPSKPSAGEDVKSSVLSVGGRLWENGRVRQQGGEPEMCSALSQAPLSAGFGNGGFAGVVCKNRYMVLAACH